MSNETQKHSIKAWYGIGVRRPRSSAMYAHGGPYHA